MSLARTLTVVAYAVPFIPVLFVRASVMFRIPPIFYVLLSVFIALRMARATRVDSQPHAAADVK